MASIVQWNCRGFWPNFNELKNITATLKPPVFCLQEVLLKSTDKGSMKGYSSYIITSEAVDGRPIGGSSILVHDSVPHRQLSLKTSLQAVAVRVSFVTTVTVCSLYIPPRYNLCRGELEDLLSQLPAPVLLLGDFNAHSDLWDHRRLTSDVRGSTVEHFLLMSSLCLFNDGSPTYLHPGNGAQSALDLSLCSPSLFQDLTWKIFPDLCGSDHHPIILKFNSESPKMSPRWLLSKADWETFEALCSESITEGVLEFADNPVELLSELITDAAKQAVPISSGNSIRVRRPWFNDECKILVRNRRSAQKAYEKHPDPDHRAAFNRARAKARAGISKAKKESWRGFISKLNHRTASKNIWDMVRKIRGKTMSPMGHLVDVHGQPVSDPYDIACLLGKTISHNSSTDHYSAAFRHNKRAAESNNISFLSDNNEPYNSPFAFSEFQKALRQCSDTATGPDNIHYQFLKHLSPYTQALVVRILNRVWVGETFPSAWRQAIIIPLAKPFKDSSNPTNYRPIALTSCLCKTMERLVNNRLVWYLEFNKHLNVVQSGFRKNRSTLDHLVSLETFIRDANACREHAVGIFFDLEKAYDTTWKHGILTDLHDMGLRGRLPIFISNFLAHRQFRVRVGSSLSDVYPQEMGVPQGSILSVTLFIVKINNIDNVIPRHIYRSLFVDDLAICARGKRPQSVDRQLQLVLLKLQRWCDCNGFRFSPTKTVVVHFCNQLRLHDEPSLTLNGSIIPVVKSAKFLGIKFDDKLNFKEHIAFVRGKALKSLNLLKVISAMDWGADRQVLLQLYRSFVLSKLDYGSAVYGSARPSYIKRLETVQNQGLRICLGAYKTSPAASMEVEANIPPLKFRRHQLALQYGVKLMGNQLNPTYQSVFTPNRSEFYNIRPSFIRPMSYRILEDIELLQQYDIMQQKTPDVEPWTIKLPEIDLSLAEFRKKDHPDHFWRGEFCSLLEKYNTSTVFYTDGSKSDSGSACAFYHKHLPMSARLPGHMSVFTTELIAIVEAVELVSKQDFADNDIIIASDSLSSIQALYSMDLFNPLVFKILKLCTSLFHTKDQSVVFVWCPSHVGIPGNEKADRLARQALDTDEVYYEVPASDLKPLVKALVFDRWQHKWDEGQSKLKEIKSVLGPPSAPLCSRRDDIVLTRLRIGHSRLTHKYLLAGEPPPECYSCNEVLTVRHLLLDCVDFNDIRQRFYNKTSLKSLFTDVSADKILGFVKAAGLFYLL